jgi:hypothetical protein
MAKARKKGAGKAAPQRTRTTTYKGHEIFYPEDQRRKKIFIDGRPVKWGEVGGTYYLDVYAYDRGGTLDETVKRYIDYLDAVSATTGRRGQ